MEKQHTYENILELIAQAYCTERNKEKEVDSALCISIGILIYKWHNSVIEKICDDEKIAQILLDTKMKEAERNTGLRYHKEGYKISSCCSCCSCQQSYLQAKAISTYIKEVVK